MFISSDVVALNRHTTRVSYLDTDEIAIITPEEVSYMDFDQTHLTKEIESVDGDTDEVTRGEYKHYMLKEIFDQPQSIRKIIFEKTNNSQGGLSSINPVLSSDEVARIERVVLLSQSGETADTLAAMETAKLKDSFQIAICNRVGTQATRMADVSLLIDAGQEIGVAATKTFTNTLVALYLLAVSIGHQKRVLSDGQVDLLIKEVNQLPSVVQKTLNEQQPYIEIAEKFHTYDNFLYLGRGLNYPIAMEGALKLKEISYIHAEGYPAGEMKHGPISLIDEKMPVVALIPKDTMHSKMLSNINEAKARNGIVIAVATDEDSSIDDKADYVLRVPEVTELLIPVVNSIPLQLLAYHIALRRGCSVDQPRNLAKSVTVE